MKGSATHTSKFFPLWSSVKRVVVALLLPVAALSCTKRESSAEFSNVTISISVPQDVSTDMLRAFLYDSASGALCGQLFISSCDEMGTFTTQQQLRRGKYDIVAYNFDVPDTYIRGESNISTLEAYTAEVNDGIKARYGEEVTQSGTITYTPDPLVVARIKGAEFKEGAVISAEASSVVSDIQIRLAADGLSWATTRSAVVDGFASSYFLGTGETGNAGRLYFELEKSGSSTLSASVPTFGACASSFDFVINVTTSEGSYNYKATTDGSFKFEKAINIPEPSNQGGDEDKGGFEPQIGQWNNISVDIPII